MGSGTADRAKGRIKQAIGSLTGDRKQKREGEIEETAGDVKDTASDLVDRAKRKLTR